MRPKDCVATKVALILVLFGQLVTTSYGQEGPASHPFLNPGSPFGTMSPRQAPKLIFQGRQVKEAEATVLLSEQFFNSFLESIFENLNPPSAPLIITASDKDRAANGSSAACPSVIVLQKENSGVKTAIKFEPGKIAAPLAFSGSYNSTLLGCLQFEGWASTTWNLEFDRIQQTLGARIKVNDIHLNNVPSFAGGSIVTLVQTAIDSRINPVKLLRVDQLTAIVPVSASNGALRLRAKEIVPEAVAGALNLHLTFEFLPER